jgi:hypothetical protein
MTFAASADFKTPTRRPIGSLFVNLLERRFITAPRHLQTTCLLQSQSKSQRIQPAILSVGAHVNKKVQEVQQAIVAINGLLRSSVVSSTNLMRLEAFKAELEAELASCSPKKLTHRLLARHPVNKQQLTHNH